jgi:hypothetical protein
LKPEFSQQIFEKYSNIKFHENPSSGSRVFQADVRKDVTKLIVAFRNFANAPKKKTESRSQLVGTPVRIWEFLLASLYPDT